MKNKNIHSLYSQTPTQGEFKPLLVAVEKGGNNEFFIKEENETGYLVTHPQGIRAWVWKKGFTIKRVDADYEIKRLKANR